MKALKLLSPVIVLLLLAAGGFWIYRHYRQAQAPAEDINAFRELQKSPLDEPLDPDKAFPAARSAFDFSISHLEVEQEWWYLNTHLIDQENRRYTFMVAFLKDGQVFGSLSTLDSEHHYPLYERTILDVDPGNRLVKTEWSTLRQPAPNQFAYEFTFNHPLADLNLTLIANKLPLPVGGEGYVAMGEAGKSYYYSLTNMRVNGSGTIGGKQVQLQGRGWMDRQWGTWRDRDFDQWHWYSIQLTNNVELMIFDFRKNGKSITPLCDVILADGTVQHGLRFKIKILGHWTSPQTQKIWSSGWQLDIPDLKAQLTVIPDMPDQEVTDALWEGGCRVSGTYQNHEVWGRAFYEARHRTW